MATYPYKSESIGGIALPRVFTTGHIAKMLGVSPATVVKKFMRTGRLRFYTVPGSLDRRVTKESLVEFLIAYGMWESIPLVSRRLMGLVSEDEARQELLSEL